MWWRLWLESQRPEWFNQGPAPSADEPEFKRRLDQLGAAISRQGENAGKCGSVDVDAQSAFILVDDKGDDFFKQLPVAK